MKHTRIIVTHYGGPDALHVVEQECPEPKSGEVRVRVLAAGVALPDLMMREGIHPETPSLPFTPGWDLIGVVDRLGDGISGIEPGQIVAALPIRGAYAEFVCLPQRELVPVPSGLDAAEAVSLVLNYVTAYQMLHRSAKVRPGQRVLIHGAAGGVGSALLQLGRLAELEMYGTCSSRGASAVSRLGGVPIDYQHVDFVEEIHRLASEGVDVVFDGIGGTHIWRSRTALRPGGKVVAYGLTASLRGGRLASGRPGRRHRFRAIAIFGVYIAGGWLLRGRKRVLPYSIQWLKRLRPAWFRQDLIALFDLLEQRKIEPLIAQRFPLTEARHAHELLGKGGVTGKIVLVRNGLESSATPRSKIDGFSPTRLARMHDTLLRHVDSGRLPGLVALLSRRGVEHVDAIGTLAFDRTAPMRRDTIFRLASVTKPITAVAAMVLVEDCKLRLDDPVDDFLPELANRNVLRAIDSELDDTVPAKRSITVRDLLTYRSGYGEVAFLSPTCPLQRALIEARLPLSAWMFPGTPGEFMQCLGRLPLAHQPGERWLYHMSAEILGVLIARVAGMPLSAFMRRRIFEPLGMKDTGFTVSEAHLDRVATCYKTDFSTGKITVLEEARNDFLAHPCVFESGAGDQFVSTADDLLAFGRMMLKRGAYGNERILSRLSVELMTTDQLTREQKAASPFFENFWDSRGWGLGISIVTRRDDIASVPGRFGWDGAFSTSLYVDPHEDMVGVLMAQCRPGALRLPPVVVDFWTSAYQAIDD